jgi:hypothetical protein
MAKRDLLKLPDDFEGNLRALLATPPAPHGTAGSRKAPPKPPTKPRRKRRKPKPPKVAGRYAYESAPVVTRKRNEDEAPGIARPNYEGRLGLSAELPVNTYSHAVQNNTTVPLC